MKTKFKLSNKILKLFLSLVMVIGLMPMTSMNVHAATQAVNIAQKIEYITYSSGAEQYFSYENYLYKVTYTNIKVNQIGIGIYGKYLVFFSPAISGNYSSLMSDKGINLKPEELPKNKNSSLVAYSLSTSISTSVGRMVKVATITLVEVDEPTWTWNDTSSATATFTAKGADVFTTADATISSEVLSTATDCKTKEQVKYTASVTFNGQTYTDTKVEEGEEVGPHSFTYSASGNIISESCENDCGHSATATLFIDPSVSLSYTGSEIKPLKVEYSDGWQGETLDISYQNNTAVSTDSNKASGNIIKDGVSATQEFTITKATMNGISVNGYSGEYDGNAHSISITGVPEGATIGYRTSENESYTAVNPSYKEIGTYTVYYKIEKENYETITGSETVVISQATNTWTIAPSIDGWTYGQTANTPSASAKHGEVKVEYRLASKTDADYTTTVPTDAGSYLVRFSVEGTENYTSLLEVVNLEIAKVKLTITADDKNTVYGESNPALTWQITEGTMVGSDALQNISISREEGKDADSYTITVSQTDGSNPNYDITFKNGTFTIKQKEIGINWGATEFMPYTGELIVPQATATGLEAGDECLLTTSVVETSEGAGIIPARWHAKVTALSNGNYCLPESGNLVEIEYGIVKGYVDAPVVSGIDETIKGKADGKINGLTTAMEYATEFTADDDKYTKVTDANMTFAAGTYYVRYQAAGYYNASTFTEVIINDGELLNVSIPATQTGYTLSVENSELVWNDSTMLTFVLADGYSKTDAFALKVNNVKVDLDADGKYVITNAQDNITVTVEGVADITAPDTEIEVKDNSWSEFLNSITFGVFFKETHDVTITASDTGSGVKSVEYYLADEAMTLDTVKAITAWEKYNGSFKIDPDNQYVIYAKVSDNAGNVAYISSDGIVLDATAPVISGIEDGKTYYTTQKFTVNEKNLKTLILNGNAGRPDGEPGVLEGNVDKTYVIQAIDHAGNTITVTITMKPISDLSALIDGLNEDNVNSSNQQALKDVKDAVEAVDITNATAAEKAALKEISDKVNKLEEVIADTEAENKRISDAVDSYDLTTVTSDDKEDLKELLTDIDELLEGDNLTADEKDDLKEVKETAEALIKKIDDVADAINTENVEKVKDITSDNVTTDDKTNLEEAKNDLEQALGDYKDNFTDDEKKAIEDDIKRIEEALEIIGKVEIVEELIEKIPNDISKNDADAIKDAEDAYNALTDYEKSLVDKDAKKKLEDAISTLAELNKPKAPSTSDNSNMWLWFILLLISGTGALGFTLYERKRVFINKQ